MSELGRQVYKREIEPTIKDATGKYAIKLYFKGFMKGERIQTQVGHSTKGYLVIFVKASKD